MEHVSIIDAHNQVLSLIHKNDEKLDKIFETINSTTCDLDNGAVSPQDKYDAVISCEYLLVKARFLTEFEHLKVKSLIADPDTPQTLKSTFLKRDQYLAQVSLKLNAIRDDIAVLQKAVYVTVSRNMFK